MYRNDFTCVSKRLRFVAKRLVAKRLCSETTGYPLKTVSVKEMETNFVRVKVPEFKKYLQVREFGVADKRPEELLDLSVEAHNLVIKIRDEQGDRIFGNERWNYS